MCCAVSYSNTFNGLVKLALCPCANAGHSWGHYTNSLKGGGSNWTMIGWLTRQKLSVNKARIYRQPVGMRQLFCAWILDGPTLLPATFCSLIAIMSPWTGVEIHRGVNSVQRGDLNVVTKPKCVTRAFCSVLDTNTHETVHDEFFSNINLQRTQFTWQRTIN